MILKVCSLFIRWLKILLEFVVYFWKPYCLIITTTTKWCIWSNVYCNYLIDWLSGILLVPDFGNQYLSHVMCCGVWCMCVDGIGWWFASLIYNIPLLLLLLFLLFLVVILIIVNRKKYNHTHIVCPKNNYALWNNLDPRMLIIPMHLWPIKWPMK